MTVRMRMPGEFCWINMLTPEPAKAREFFSAVLGWTYFEMPGNMGHAIQVGGRNVGGLFDLNGPNTPPGTPPGIGVMVRVDSADEVAARAASLGGTSKPAFDIMEQGRMAECVDPSGATFDLWQPMKGSGTDCDASLHGAPSWFETITTDVARARKFYADLFGWTFEVTKYPDFEYTSFKLGSTFVAGMMAITPDMGPMPPHWGVYFTSSDVDKTARDAVAHGGVICVPPRDIPGVGRFCGITSPQGVTFYAMTYHGM